MPVKHRDQGWIGTLAVALALLPTGPCATAQEGIDIRSRFDSSPGGTLPGNRPGMSIGRGGPFRKDMLPVARPDRLAPPPVVGDVVPTAPVELKLKDPRKPLGAEDGTTLGGTIEVMRRQNPDIIAAASEVDQARSDMVTAGLRSNPQFYADMQLVPYSILAPGQVDVNIAYPVDVSGKRRTRIKSAACVLRSVEWQFRDFDRHQCDNIQTLFVDTLSSQVTVDFMQKAHQTSVGLRDEAEKKLKEVIRLGKPARERSQHQLERDRAENELRDAKQALDDVKSQLRDQLMALGLFLSISNPGSIRLQGWLYDGRTYTPTRKTSPRTRERS